MVAAANPDNLDSFPRARTRSRLCGCETHNLARVAEGRNHSRLLGSTAAAGGELQVLRRAGLELSGIVVPGDRGLGRHGGTAELVAGCVAAGAVLQVVLDGLGGGPD